MSRSSPKTCLTAQDFARLWLPFLSLFEIRFEFLNSLHTLPQCILFIVFSSQFSLPSVSVTGILAEEDVVVHTEAHVVALCFVSR